MIRLQIIDLFLEHNGPKVLAEEFDDVQRFGEERSVAGESAVVIVQISAG